ncbi:hypothetical protein CPC08DRAFT_705875 [Agrocybe pediades]|nr:hypothetical protein CPC08DRAFT_705875 [Agrocybe pediades]
MPPRRINLKPPRPPGDLATDVQAKMEGITSTCLDGGQAGGNQSATTTTLQFVQEGEPPAKGKKRGRKPKEGPPEGRPNKRVKIDGSAASGRKPLKAAAGQPDSNQLGVENPVNVVNAKKSVSKSKEQPAVKWKVVPVTPSSLSANSPIETTLKPRLWTGGRKEFLAAFPEMGGSQCFNNVSWELYNTPTILLDDNSNAFDVRRLDMDPYTMDLLTTRSFVCPCPPLEINNTVDVAMAEENIINAPAAMQPPPSTGKGRVGRLYRYPPLNKFPDPDGDSYVKIDFRAPLPMFSALQPGEAPFTISPDREFGERPEDRPLKVPFMHGPDTSEQPLLSRKQCLSPLDLAALEAEVKAKVPPLGRDLRSCSEEEYDQGVAELEALYKFNPKKATNPMFDEARRRLDEEKLHLAFQASVNVAPGAMTWPESTPLPNNSSSLVLEKELMERLCNATRNPPFAAVNASTTASLPPEKQSKETQPQQDSYIPSPLPREIQAIIDAYISGQPLVVVVTHRQLHRHWGLRLPEKYGHIVMGYFRIVGVQETRIDSSSVNGLGSAKSGSLVGHAQWRFRLRWAPGGEEYIMPHRDLKELEHPWWHPPLPEDAMHESLPQEATAMSLDDNSGVATMALEYIFPKDLEDCFETTPRYRAARLANHEYQFRNNHFSDVYESILPTRLLAPFGPSVLDNLFARGWFCLDCGKINFQASLRHRKCTNSDCKDKPPPVEPYAIPLVLMRDPQDRLPLSLPYNTYPANLRVKLSTFDDGVQVASYYNCQEELAFIKHVYTGNHLPRQAFATRLLDEIQRGVELVRPMDDTGPYFVFLAASPKGHLKPTDTDWPDVPIPVNQAKRDIVRRARIYAEVHDNQFSIDRVKMLAWVTTGSKKATDILRTKSKAVTFLSLGCDVELTLIPRGDWPTMKNIIQDDAITTDEPSASKSVKAELLSQAPEKRAKNVKKADRPTFNLKIVHGDVVVLYGEDFEYSIKRDGTSILVITSHED